MDWSFGQSQFSMGFLFFSFLSFFACVNHSFYVLFPVLVLCLFRQAKSGRSTPFVWVCISLFSSSFGRSRREEATVFYAES